MMMSCRRIVALALTLFMIARVCNSEAPTIPFIYEDHNETYTSHGENATEPPHVTGTIYKQLFFATPSMGAYNHAAMIGVFEGVLTATWKNAPTGEDEAGQRVLYSQSTDGDSWTPVDETTVAFPNMSTTANPVHLFAEPMVTVNGRSYIAASPKQFCLYPDEYFSLLLLRQVLGGVGNFGKAFWASESIPAGFEVASQLNGIVTVGDMDPTTVSDVKTLQNPLNVPCNDAETSKCEYCEHGCQPWEEARKVAGIENERSHYFVPGSTGAEVLMYRSFLNKGWPRDRNYLYASVRFSVGDNWTLPVATNITNDVSNFDTGNLPDGRAYLVNNWAGGKGCVVPCTIRNPLTLSIGGNDPELNYGFKKIATVADCFDKRFAGEGKVRGCWPRHKGNAKVPGPQYPQSMILPRAAGMVPSGLYTVFSMNKEDIWVARMPLPSLEAL